MIDQRLLIQDLEGCIQKLHKKGDYKEGLINAQKLILEKNKKLEQAERLRKQKNDLARQAGNLAAEKKLDQMNQIKEQAARLKQDLEKEEKELSQTKQQLENLLLNMPNFPHEKAPRGRGAKDNVEILRENFDEKHFESKDFIPHWEIMEKLDIFDQKRAGKITGSMFAVLKGQGAKLLRALLSFAFDVFESDYTEFSVPSVVNSASLTGTGQLPKFSEEAYHIEKDDLWAIPTGEVPLTNLHRGEILEAAKLPLKYMACTPCFRREAGAAGQETRGLQRLHEFHKLELVKICKASESEKELETLLQDALKPIRLLKLPLRVLDLCGGDLTFSSARTYDIEIYSPGTKSWLEVSSVSLFTDYQSRRSQMRYREGKKISYVHTLNGSGLASPRVLAGLLENFWENGKVKIPPVLTKYMPSEYL